MYTSTQQSEFAKKFGNWISGRIVRLETILLTTFILFLIIQLTFSANNIPFITIPLLGFAIIYFFSAFHEVETDMPKGLDAFFYKMAGFGSSIAVMGILFKLNNWPGYETTLTTGAIVAGILFVVGLIRRTRDFENPYFTQPLLIRLFVIAVMTGILIFIQEDILTLDAFTTN